MTMLAAPPAEAPARIHSSREEEPPQVIRIGSERACDCPPSRLNCLTAKEWMKSQVGVWQFTYNGKDIRDKTLHPATFPVALAEHVIKLFTHKGELVVDPFVGSGTTLVAAQELGRNAVGADLSQEYVDLSNSRLGLREEDGAHQLAVAQDARNLADLLEPGAVKLLFASPPYADMLNHRRANKSRRSVDRRNEQFGKVEQYSQDARDLGTLDPIAYGRTLGEIYERLLPTLKPGGHAVINVNDLWRKDQRVPLHSIVTEAMQSAGYLFKNIIIWDRTNIVNRIGIFGWPSNYITIGATFEYILHFRKPSRRPGAPIALPA